jgi:hypothetical protein
MPAVVLGALSLGIGLLPGAYGQDAARTAGEEHSAATRTITPAADTPALRFANTPTAGSGRIAYKQDNSGGGVGALFLRVAGGIALMTALAFAAAVVAKRYLPGIRGYSSDGKSRIQLLESRRVTPKLTLFVIEYEGRRVLLAQSGDRVVEIGAQRE